MSSTAYTVNQIREHALKLVQVYLPAHRAQRGKQQIQVWLVGPSNQQPAHTTSHMNFQVPHPKPAMTYTRFTNVRKTNDSSFSTRRYTPRRM